LNGKQILFIIDHLLIFYSVLKNSILYNTLSKINSLKNVEQANYMHKMNELDIDICNILAK